MSAIESSKQIWSQALEQYQPYAVLLALSGGNDSRAAYYSAKALGIKLDGILHCRTGTGIEQTTDWVKWFAQDYARLPLILGDAGNTYERRVLSHGFPGLGRQAHSIMFHLLKRDAYTAAISREVRQRRRNRTVFLINGARLAESDNRAKNFANCPVRPDKVGSSNVWVNLLQHWSKDDCQAICDENRAPQNPVAQQLCRSGECMCGSMQPQSARIEASAIYPEWGQWLDDLERRVTERFPWRWGQQAPQQWAAEKAGQMRLFDYQPMCSDCVRG